MSNQISKVVFNTQLIITLIGEELKSHKFFSALRSVGLDDAFYQTDLSSIIITSANMDAESNEALDFYFGLLDKYSQMVDPSKDSLQKASALFYSELLEGKIKKRNN
jgi:hypothetical protein